MTPAQKLSVAKMVPEVIQIVGGNFYWLLTARPILENDWLYICHCAEGKLTDGEHRRFRSELWNVIGEESPRAYISATEDQRAEALERVVSNR